VSDLRRFEDFAVGESAAIDRVVRADDVARFAELTGDDNPLHLDDDFASVLGLGGRVVHGMLTAGYVSTVIGTLLPGPGALWLSESFRFRSPVRVNDEIHVEVRIRHLSPSTGVVVLDVTVTNENGSVVLDGEANVQVLGATAQRRDDSPTARSSHTPSGQPVTTGCAVVTGSGRGIGAAIAARLAAVGLPVVVNYRSDGAQADRTTRAITDTGGRARVCQADVTDSDSVTALFDFAVQEYGPVSVLVNNAGGTLGRRALTETSWEEMERHLNHHLRASFLCVQAVLPAMIDRRMGRIINVTSQAAYGVPPAAMTGYTVAKAALAALTRSIAVEASPFGVTANAVAPGMVETDLVADVSPRTKLTLAAQSPTRHLVTPSQVADAVAFLAGPGAAEVTGQTIHLSGGMVMT
jgi:3-oxoacyl-[acyl-carrier protein] reductase